MKRNVQRHIRQLLAYLDTAISELEAGQREGVAGALLYPSRPASPETLACIQAAADEQAIMVTLTTKPTGAASFPAATQSRPPR